MSDYDGIVTYAEQAATLPRDIVESIETSLPCAFSANRIHMWDVWAPAGMVPLWSCVYCGVHTTTHPRMPVVSSPSWNILTADEILRAMS